MIAHRTAFVSLCLTNFLVAKSSGTSFNLLATGIIVDRVFALQLLTLFVLVYGLMYFWRWSIEFDWFSHSNYDSVESLGRSLTSQLETVSEIFARQFYRDVALTDQQKGELNRYEKQLNDTAMAVIHITNGFSQTFKYKKIQTRLYAYISMALIPAITMAISIYSSIKGIIQ